MDKNNMQGYWKQQYEEYFEKYYKECSKTHWGEFIFGLALGLVITIFVCIITYQNMQQQAIDAGVAEYMFVPDQPNGVFVYKEIK